MRPLRHSLRNLLPDGLRARYHEYALRRDFGIDRRKGTRRPALLDPRLPQGLNVVGYFGSPSGVGQSARAIASAAEEAGEAIARIEASSVRRSDQTGAPYDVNLYHVNADAAAAVVEELGSRAHAGRANIAYWYWETEKFPGTWRDRFDYFDEVWVASEYCRKTIEAVSPLPVVVVPPAVTLPTIHDFSADPSYPSFRFLTVFDALSVPERKNPLGTIRAFARAFPDPSSASLLVSVSNAERVPGLSRAMREAAGSARVLILEEEAVRSGMAAQFSACDAYVSLHRAEGFGFPIAEAMSLGKPAIATDYSGSADYLDETTGFPVRWKPMTLSERIRDYEAGTTWAEPDEAHAVETLRRVVSDRGEAARRAEAGRRRVAALYGPSAVGAKVRAQLQALRARLGKSS